MSSSFFPDNVKRYERVQGLRDNISNLQRDISAKYDSFQNYENAMLTALDDLRKYEGLSSMQALADKVKSELPGDVQQAYIESNKGVSVFGETADTISTVSAILAKSASTAEKVAVAIRLLKSVPIVRGILQLAKGIKLIVTEGLEVGIQFLKTTAQALKLMYETAALGETLSQALNIITKVSIAMEYVSYFLNVVTFILQILEEKAQRDKLIENIHVALPARISVSYYRDQADHTANNLSLMMVYIQMYVAGQKGDQGSQTAANALADSLFTTLPDTLISVAIDEQIQQWAAVDKNLGAYTADDLSPADLKAKTLQDIDQYNADVQNAEGKTT